MRDKVRQLTGGILRTNIWAVILVSILVTFMVANNCLESPLHAADEHTSLYGKIVPTLIAFFFLSCQVDETCSGREETARMFQVCLFSFKYRDLGQSIRTIVSFAKNKLVTKALN